MRSLRATGAALLSVLAISCGGGTPAPSAPPPEFSVSGHVDGVTVAGVTLTLAGAVAITTVTDEAGHYSFPNLQPGSYTLTPSAGDLAFSPPAFAFTFVPTNPDNTIKNFVSTPHSVPPTITVKGDAASRIAGGTFTARNVPFTGALQPGLETNPDVLVHDTLNNSWVFSVEPNGSAPPGMNGFIVFDGVPEARSYTAASTGLKEASIYCWQEDDINVDPPLVGMWVVSDFTLTFDSATKATTNMPALEFYAVHGTFHGTCTAIPGSGQGTLTVDIPF